MHKTVLLSASVLSLAASVATVAPTYAATAGVKVGVLSCNVDSGFGFILGSSRDIRCNYVPNSGGSERYTGTITRIGVDIGYIKGGVLIWTVVAPSSDVKPGALAGQYGGVTASATVGVGLGANALIGGFNKSVALQPLSIEGTTGLNVAAGVAGLTLTAEKR
jgi:Protein of unknown function (DUF992)